MYTRVYPCPEEEAIIMIALIIIDWIELTRIDVQKTRRNRRFVKGRSGNYR